MALPVAISLRNVHLLIPFLELNNKVNEKQHSNNVIVVTCKFNIWNYQFLLFWNNFSILFQNVFLLKIGQKVNGGVPFNYGCECLSVP